MLVITTLKLNIPLFCLMGGWSFHYDKTKFKIIWFNMVLIVIWSKERRSIHDQMVKHFNQKVRVSISNVIIVKCLVT